MQADRPFLGMLLMVGFCILAPMGDAIAKLLGSVMSVGAMVMIRFGAQALFLFPLALMFRLPIPAGRRLLSLIAVRTVLHIAGIAMMFSALKYLPLADALAIAFVMPFLMLLAGWLFLGEEVGPHRLGACAVGFAGTLLVIQPNFAAVGWPALLPLGVAVTFVGFMLVTRMMAKDVDPVSMQAVSGAMALAVLGPVALVFPDWPPLSLAGVGGAGLGMVLALGLIGTLAHLLMTWSLRFAPSATLAPMQYLEIPFGTLIGWLIFRDLPNGLAALGISVTIGAGLYIIARERRLSRQPQPGQAPPAA
ncbi:DMT family transporter [Loktanella sp. IMCC34160]|uniref:DMT family transporter n=1 Tax=Loktanella sp. IMCC34160 TaxID=2510646 RepID=UPI00101DEDAA|nr:DMT family transporter [Loktanella sp. IMCC34160]RYG92339.1 DMT family transporter [Loktanella sp. IMCC34160]